MQPNEADIPKIKKNPWAVQVAVFPNLRPGRGWNKLLFTGIGIVVRAAAAEPIKSAILVQNMIRW